MKVTTDPLISVIMPTYNRSNILMDAVESVLAQTWENLEVLVVDDRSTDATADTVRPLAKRDTRVRYIQNEGVKGCSGAKNFGMRFAKGEYVAFLDDDDTYLSEKLKEHIACFRDHGEADCVVLGVSSVAGVSRDGPYGWLRFEFRPYRVFHPAQVMWRASIKEKLSFCGDYMEWRDLAYQLYRVGAVVHLSDKQLVRIASTQGQMSSDRRLMFEAALRNAEEYCQETRGTQENDIFRRYLANCYKDLANYHLKKGRVFTAAAGYLQSFGTWRNLRNLIPFA
jgi:glycosyltransferase involved in cell wall biosynthesis